MTDNTQQSMMREMEELLSRRSELQMEMRETESRLEQILVDFDGSLLDALKMGIVRPNFATTPGFKHFLNSK